MNTIHVGDKAPDFTLQDESGNEHTLSKALQNGPVVLSMHYLDFSGVCRDQQCTLSNALNVLQPLGVTVFGISTDSTYAHKAWKAAEKIAFPLLSDYNKVVLPQYGALYDWKWMKGVARRSVFVLDRHGVVRYMWQTPDAPSNAPDIAAAVAEAKKLA
jgi:peroxiredoxin